MLTEEIAREIVKETMNRLNRNINIMDDKGTIIASGDHARINQVHAAAREVIRTGKMIILDSVQAARFPGALPGINLPIDFDGKIVGVIGITGNPEELVEFGQLVKMSTEMMLKQAVLAERTEWNQHMKEVVFNELAEPDFDFESIENRLRLLRIRMEAPFQVAVVEVELKDANRGEILQSMQVYLDESRALIGFLNVHRLFILSFRMTEEQFKEKLRRLVQDERLEGNIVHIGIGSVASAAEHIRFAYEEALCALKLGDSSGAKLLSYAEIEIKALLSRLNKRARQQFANRVLEELPPKLIETIETFVSHNLNIGKCAESMFIHRNSLNYRLKKIQEQTGYDPRVFHDAMTLQLAIWISRLKDADMA